MTSLTHVWVVWYDATAGGGGQGILAAYPTRAEAVSRVQRERREWCDTEDGVRLRDWSIEDTPDEFSASYHLADPVLVYEARRLDVRAVNQPAYVWVVEDQEDESGDVAPGVVGIYTTRARAVKHVRALRREACASSAAYDDKIKDGDIDDPYSYDPDALEDEEYERLRLSDFEESDEPTSYSLTTMRGHSFVAYRRELNS